MNKFYFELKITPSSHYELYLDLCLSLYEDGIEELDNSIIIRSEEKLDDIAKGIDYFTKQLQESLDKNITCDMQIKKKENKDWIAKYKSGIKPVTVGKFYIHPSWNEPKEDKINILIDPALAFGSGHHETTSSCLLAIGDYVKKGNHLIDVGSGSGILAIAASKIGAICDICDTDPLAIENSLKNFELNSVKCNDSWVGSVVKSTRKYDVVVANIVADILILINKDLKKVLKENGILIVSGILETYLDKVMKKFDDFNIIKNIKKNEWGTLVLKRKGINEQSTK